jgi:hypothetical protein
MTATTQTGSGTLIEMTIKGLMVDPITNMPIVILKDKGGDRVLPIWVGIFEANAIALQIENVATPRPMTHDLLRNIIADLDGDVERVRATPSPWPSARGRRSWWRSRSSTTPRPSTSARASARTMIGCRSGWKALILRSLAATRCKCRPADITAEPLPRTARVDTFEGRLYNQRSFLPRSGPSAWTGASQR